MKVAYTSDIHADITTNNRLLVPYLVNRVKEITPDVFVIAGDISNSLDSLDSTLKQFNQLQCLKVMIPGNHDVWVESNNSVRKGKDSFYKYRQAIPRACKSRVTVSSGKVTNIELLKNKENQPLEFTNRLFNRVIEAQSLKVDTISGATLTSKAYLQGVENALEQAQK
ncbi:MAG: FMN-binding protein [Bacillota bacterium]